MLKTGSYVTASEAKVLKTYEGDSHWTLFAYEGHAYIGQKVSKIMTKDYRFIPVTEATFEVRDDDANHLNDREFEGIFEMRCDDMEAETRALAADFYA